MLGLTPGELLVVIFVTVAVITASWWPRAGAAIAELLSSARGQQPARPAQSPPSTRPVDGDP